MANSVHLTLWYLDGARLFRNHMARTFQRVPSKPDLRRAVDSLAAAAQASGDCRADQFQADLGEALDVKFLWDAAKRSGRASVESPRGWIVSIVADGGAAQ